MMNAVLLCLCSSLCVCGCQSGEPCKCPHRVVAPAGACDCEKCEGDCKCRAIAKPCGGNCNCVVGQDFGVDMTKVGKGRYNCNGKNVTREAVASRLVDDSRMLRLTIIEADEKERKRRVDAVHALDLVKQRCLVASYEPGHWAVSKFTPGVWLQAPDGTVLLKSEVLDVDALLRKLRGDPDPVTPKTEAGGVPLWAWGLGIVALLLLMKRR